MHSKDDERVASSEDGPNPRMRTLKSLISIVKYKNKYF